MILTSSWDTRWFVEMILSFFVNISPSTPSKCSPWYTSLSLRRCISKSFHSCTTWGISRSPVHIFSASLPHNNPISYLSCFTLTAVDIGYFSWTDSAVSCHCAQSGWNHQWIRHCHDCDGLSLGITTSSRTQYAHLPSLITNASWWWELTFDYETLFILMPQLLIILLNWLGYNIYETLTMIQLKFLNWVFCLI
jgi:hypothetical protein